MVISVEKSSFLINNVSIDIIQKVKVHFLFKIEALEMGFKYLGFWLKPIPYMVAD